MISIIIPCYNIAAFVGRTLQSVISQSDGDWEVIAVDDGSTDDTLAVLNKFAAKDWRIHVIHKENGGVSSARNLGIGKAKGEWIYFLDGDDLISPDLIGRIKTVSRNNTIDLLVFDFVMEKEGVVERSYRVRNPQTLFADYLTNRQSIHISSTAIKRRFLIDRGIKFDEHTSYGEDREFIARIFSFRPKYLCLDFVGFRYQIREGSAMTNRVYNVKRFSSVLASERTYKNLQGQPEGGKALVVLAFTIIRHLKMYYAFQTRDEVLENKLKSYVNKYVKGFHFYGIGHIEFYTMLAGIACYNQSLLKLFFRLR